jgi:hypothetical protein
MGTVLWLTGSRAALAAAPVAVIGAMALTAPGWWRGRGWTRVVIGVTAVICIGVAAFLPLAVKDPARPGVIRTASIRWDLNRAAVLVAADHPAFGVGVGGYMAASAQYLTPQLKAWFGHENAHNNFLQVLAELGLVGLMPFLWLLGEAALRVYRAARDSRLSGPLFGAASGLLAFVATWFTGHPLLTHQIAAAFWILLGACVGLAEPEAGEPNRAGSVIRPRLLRAVAVLIVAILVTVPLRARHQLQNTDMSTAGIGFSPWERDSDGVVFRWLDAARGQFYLPVSLPFARLPLRLVAEPGATAEVELFLDGRLANRVLLTSGRWELVTMILPRRQVTDFHRVEVRRVAATQPSQETPAEEVRTGVQVGKPFPSAAPTHGEIAHESR